MSECNEVAVDTEQLRSQIINLQDDVDMINDNIGNLYDAITVLNQMWDGEANQEFCQRFDEDRELLEDICRLVQRIINGMDNARQEYEICESNNQLLVGEIRL